MLLPFEEFMLLGGGTGTKAGTLSRLIGLLVIIFFTYKFLLSKTSLRLNKAQLWLVVFGGFACLSFAWSIDPEAAIGRIPTALSLLLLYLVVGTFMTSAKGLDLLILMIVAGGVVGALGTIYSYHFLGMVYGKSARASLILGEKSFDPNFFVFTLLLPWSFLLLKITQASGLWRRWHYFPALLLIGYAVLLTASRSGFLAIAVISSFYILHNRSKGYMAIAVTLIIMAIVGVLSSDLLLQRLTFQQDSFEHARGGIWLTTLPALWDHWLLGGGLESFGKIYMDASNLRESGAHNIFFCVLQELGIVGLFILSVALVQHYKALRINPQSQTNTAFALKAALMGMLVQGLFLDILWKKSFWLVLALIMMVSAGATKVSSQRR
jgi:O-antigen ligase